MWYINFKPYFLKKYQLLPHVIATLLNMSNFIDISYGQDSRFSNYFKTLREAWNFRIFVISKFYSRAKKRQSSSKKTPAEEEVCRIFCQFGRAVFGIGSNLNHYRFQFSKRKEFWKILPKFWTKTFDDGKVSWVSLSPVSKVIGW